MIRIGLFPNCCRSFARSFSARLAGPESTSRMPWSPTWAVRLMSPGRWIMYTLPCTGSTPISSLFWFCCARMSGANAKKRTQPRMTRITPNGRIKGFLTRPFGVIRVIRGWVLFFAFAPLILAQQNQNSDEIGVLPVQGKVYMIHLPGDINLTAQVGDQGILLVDSGPANLAEKLLAKLRQQFGNKPIRIIINTHVHADHTGGNAAIQKAEAAVRAARQGGGG